VAIEKPSPIDVFLRFKNAEYPELVSKTNPYVTKKGSPESYFLRYIISFQNRIWVINHIVTNINYWMDKALEEYSRVQTNGSSSFNANNILTFYFETLADVIFKIMETIANINLMLFNPKKNGSRKFLKQTSLITNGQLSFSSSYDHTVKKYSGFFSTVGRIRHNSTHFLTGMTVYSKGPSGEASPEYLNYELRESPNEVIDTNQELIYGYRQIIPEIISETSNWLNDVCSSYLELLDRKKKYSITVLYPDRIEIQQTSIDDFVDGIPGEVVNTVNIHR
jgi:hypothetical protein